MSITPSSDEDESPISNIGPTRWHRPTTDTLAEVVADAMATWPATLRLCLIGLAFSLPAMAIIMLILLTH